MELSFYLDHGSFFHRLDGLTKLALLLGTCVAALARSDAPALGALFGAVCLHLALARCLGNLRRVSGFLALLTVVTTVVWAASGRGETPLFLWVRREGLLAGLAASLRIDAFVLAGTAFLSTTRNEEILQALQRLRVPYPLCFAFSTALRLAPGFVGLGFAVREAQRARGLDPEAGSPLERLRKSIPVLVPAFLSTLRMTGQLAMSLESRGFGFTARRTSLLESRPGWRDAMAVLALLGLLTATFRLR